MAGFEEEGVMRCRGMMWDVDDGLGWRTCMHDRRVASGILWKMEESGLGFILAFLVLGLGLVSYHPQ